MSRIVMPAGILKPWRLGKQDIIKPHTYDYFLILDLEATCERNKRVQPQEIIELPTLKVNGRTAEIESVFHRYVRPRHQLSPFCTELTGILQEMVDTEPHFEDVFYDFCKWMEEEKLWTENTKSVFVTCGDWDLKYMLPEQCRQLNIPVPICMTKWINIKKVFAIAKGHYPKRDIPDMMGALGLQQTGRLHSGIDDVKNIHKILQVMIKENYDFSAGLNSA